MGAASVAFAADGDGMAVSLIYSVNVPPGEDTASTIEQTIAVLKDRVDPQGTLEISFVRQGRTGEGIEPGTVSEDVPGGEGKTLIRECR